MIIQNVKVQQQYQKIIIIIVLFSKSPTHIV